MCNAAVVYHLASQSAYLVYGGIRLVGRNGCGLGAGLARVRSIRYVSSYGMNSSSSFVNSNIQVDLAGRLTQCSRLFWRNLWNATFDP